MIKLLIRLGKWLEARFPERKVIGDAEFKALILRIENLEVNSAHIDALKTIVLKMKELQDEFATIKTGLGLTGAKSSELVTMMLNGEAI